MKILEKTLRTLYFNKQRIKNLKLMLLKRKFNAKCMPNISNKNVKSLYNIKKINKQRKIEKEI